MRWNGRFKIGAACALVCLALAGCKGATFNGSRLGNEDQYVLEYTQFNTTDSQNLELESGDVVHTQIVCDGGSVSIEVKCGDSKPVYKGDAVSESYEFDIMIEESGTYTITVTGEKAQGSVSFTVEKDAN